MGRGLRSCSGVVQVASLGCFEGGRGSWVYPPAWVVGLVAGGRGGVYFNVKGFKVAFFSPEWVAHVSILGMDQFPLSLVSTKHGVEVSY